MTRTAGAHQFVEIRHGRVQRRHGQGWRSGKDLPWCRKIAASARSRGRTGSPWSSAERRRPHIRRAGCHQGQLGAAEVLFGDQDVQGGAQPTRDSCEPLRRRLLAAFNLGIVGRQAGARALQPVSRPATLSAAPGRRAVSMPMRSALLVSAAWRICDEVSPPLKRGMVSTRLPVTS